MDAIDPPHTDKLLGLFSYSNMNVALDKIDGRRGKARGLTGRVVDDYGFPDQPMLDEMTAKAPGRAGAPEERLCADGGRRLHRQAGPQHGH